jgi:hypothetical protein
MFFRFECIKSNDVDFPGGEDFPSNMKIVHEIHFDDDTRWDNVMLQFAKFLDAGGYVGVYERMSNRLDAEWEFINNQLNGDTDEDTGHPGLSD